MAHTLVEKILLAHCDVDDVRPGDVVTVRCDVVMANDVSGPVAFRAMEKMGATLAPGDVILVNDPYAGGTHLNDVTIIYPVFRDLFKAEGATK